MTAVRALAVVGQLLLLAGGCASSAHQSQGNANQSISRTKQSDIRLAPSRPLLQAQGFAVLDFRVRRDEFSRVCVIGEIRNTGFASRAVELQATLRDARGRVLAVGHFYPASYTNIQPNETWPFAYSFGRQDDVARAELRIVGAFRTMETVNVAYEAH
jgi:hypothetical protein